MVSVSRCRGAIHHGANCRRWVTFPLREDQPGSSLACCLVIIARMDTRLTELKKASRKMGSRPLYRVDVWTTRSESDLPRKIRLPHLRPPRATMLTRTIYYLATPPTTAAHYWLAKSANDASTFGLPRAKPLISTPAFRGTGDTVLSRVHRFGQHAQKGSYRRMGPTSERERRPEAALIHLNLVDQKGFRDTNNEGRESDSER